MSENPITHGDRPEQTDSQASTGGSAPLPPNLQSGPLHPGERVGPYKVLSLVGEGGMGAVYVAEQEAPIRRQVAIKVIKLGMDTKEVVARFESERQALALMNHPNIARVFDAGSTADGRPYFVMEYVPGLPITRYCDQNRLGVRQRLELFLQLCDGVHHAHRRGLIHRDIKPTNVLVSLQDDKPVVKVVDFGVAKATNQRLTERTLFTEFGAMIGTPEYMSPEQADRSGLDVDQRTDVYSLGVLAYELLVGTLPFDSASLRRAGLAEMQRIIREKEAPAPSARLVSLGGKAEEVAKRRRIDLPTLRKELHGDLERVTMKALEKDRTRRYGTVSEFSADIGRHLRGEPVSVGPPNPLRRASRLLRENSATLLPAVLYLVAVMLIVFAVPLSRLDLWTYDFLMRLRGSLPPPADILILGIDEASIKERPWPWPRGVHAWLIRALNQLEARAVVYDLLFDAPRDPQQDEEFAAAIRDSRIPVILAADIGVTPKFSPEVFRRRGSELERIQGAARLESTVAILPLTLFRDAGAEFGFLETRPDPDMVIRRASLLVQDKPSLSLQTLARLGLTPDLSRIPKVSSDGDDLTILINFIGPGWSIPRLSCRQLLDPKAPKAADTFRNKIVLIGWSPEIVAAGDATLDGYHSPYQPRIPAMPGVEVHANILNTLLRGNYIVRPGYFVRWGLPAALFVLAWCLSLRLNSWKIRQAVRLSPPFLYAGAVIPLFLFWRYSLDPVGPGAVLCATCWLFVFCERRRRARSEIRQSSGETSVQ